MSLEKIIVKNFARSMACSIFSTTERGQKSGFRPGSFNNFLYKGHPLGISVSARNLRATFVTRRLPSSLSPRH